MDNLKYIYMIFALILIGSANAYTVYAMSVVSNRLGFIICLIFSFIIYLKYKPRFWNKDLTGILAILFIWNLIQIFVFKRHGICYSYFFDVILGFLLIGVYQHEIYFYYEKATITLAKLSLILWGCTVFFPNVMRPIMDLLSVKVDSGLCESNIFVFGLENSETSITYGPFFRNVGFAWEPGRFACLLLPAILINLSRLRFNLKNNKNFWVLSGALMSTFSTTGYAILIFIFIVYIYNKNKEKLFPLFIVFIVFMFFVVSLPFMRVKIENQILSALNGSDYLNEIEWFLNNGKDSFVPTRFQGMLYEFINFINDPWCGYGKDIFNSYFGAMFDGGLVLYNGVIKVFAVFGVFIGILYYLRIYKGSKLFSSIYGVRGDAWFLILFIFINFSYYFIFEPIFIAMLFQKSTPNKVNLKMYFR